MDELKNCKYKVGDKVVCKFEGVSGLVEIAEGKIMFQANYYRVISTGIPSTIWFREDHLKDEPYLIC